MWPKIIEIWELTTGRQQHKIGKHGGDFLRRLRPYKGCSESDYNRKVKICYSLVELCQISSFGCIPVEGGVNSMKHFNWGCKL
jgi:hypothetical protein